MKWYHLVNIVKKMKPSVHSLQVKILWDISTMALRSPISQPMLRSHFQEATDVYKRLLVEAAGLGGSDAKNTI